MLTELDSLSNSSVYNVMSDSLPIISNQDARHIFLERHGLCSPPRAKLSDDGVLEIIRSLGFVQVDSINTVARAHHMILFARNQTYRPEQLTRLLERERALFEHWTHDASIIPVEFYPYWRYRFTRDRKVLLDRWRKARHQGFEEIFEEVLAMIGRNGPTMARDIGSQRKTGRGWWDWHPEKTALEYHWRTGNLAIAGRDGFQKIYDLAENIIPKRHLNERVDEDAFIDWACRSAIERLGFATSGEIAAFWELVTPAEAAAWCQSALKGCRLTEVLIENCDERRPTRSFAVLNLPDTYADAIQPVDRLRVLSPFDPMIRDRKRCLRLFGFDYRIEIFVPAAKRQYGYYVFPLLEGDRFIGRIDMKHVKGTLRVANIWLEAGVKRGKGRIAALEAELDRHRRFVGAERVTFDCAFP